MPIRTFLFVMH